MSHYVSPLLLLVLSAVLFGLAGMPAAAAWMLIGAGVQVSLRGHTVRRRRADDGLPS